MVLQVMLPRKESLKDRRLFNFVFKKKQKLSTKLLNLYYLRMTKGINRLPKTAFVVGLRVHKKSTKRNLVKRRMTSAYQALKKKKVGIFSKAQINYVLVWVANPSIMEATFVQITDAMDHLLKKLDKFS